jgi:hypothetical protein
MPEFFFLAPPSRLCGLSNSQAMPVARIVQLSIGRPTVKRRIILNRAMQEQINKDVASRRNAIHGPARIQGGKWAMPGRRRSEQFCDADECQMSIAEFMADLERFD